MAKLIDETGNKYGRWTVLRKATKEETAGRKGGAYWVCECSCENHTIGIICGCSLRNGESRSCGCLCIEEFKSRNKNRSENIRNERINTTNTSYQGCIMKIVEYTDANNIIVEFQDENKALVHCSYREFIYESVKNPFYKEVYGVASIGDKYPAFCGSEVKEYSIWNSIIGRCYDEKIKEKQPAYKDVTICNEWLIYTNFYEWIHQQENFEKWKNGNRWAIDKDILVKHNKVYAPEFCTLVPPGVNSLFTKRQNDRGEYPIGVYYYKRGDCFRAQCSNPYSSNKRVYLGYFSNEHDAFIAYKNYKENLIKEIANNEFKDGNITKECYEAMMNYIVEEDD